MKQQIQLRRREAVDGVELPADLPPLLQRLYASRGVRSAQELERSVKGMLPWMQLTGVEKAVEMLHDAFQKGLHIVVVGDFDADGAHQHRAQRVGPARAGLRQRLLSGAEPL
ncbi:Single-stranded-DNA-specific exonuclease recJ [Serratia liquefaciens]|nr:Single-stranded-DNA-specific exonuclease recJ [Serratia liquefaciens]